MANEKRLIDANALLAEAEKAKIRFPHDRVIMFDLIKNAPTVDAVPVVRCKDCKRCHHWENKWGVSGLQCKLFCADIDPDDFCSYGERKDNE